jgi:hypothetical protein
MLSSAWQLPSFVSGILWPYAEDAHTLAKAAFPAHHLNRYNPCVGNLILLAISG